MKKRIPNINYGENKYKPFFGTLFEVDDLYYVTQVSHPQKRHLSLRQQKDFFKLFDPNSPKRLIAVINLNYMFPVHKSQTYSFEKKNIDTYRTFKSDEEKSKYIKLLNLELSIINSMDLGTKALNLYNLKYSNPEDAVSKRCINFKFMEKNALKFIQDK